jgi:hypothetical protein
MTHSKKPSVTARSALQLRALHDVFAYVHAEDVELRLDATETQGRPAFSEPQGQKGVHVGKKKQNIMKATVVADQRGRT